MQSVIGKMKKNNNESLHSYYMIHLCLKSILFILNLSYLFIAILGIFDKREFILLFDIFLLIPILLILN
jgi:hypothetical protein